MLAEDVAPNRFGAATARLLERARAEPGRRFGIVVFAGDAKEICPPTADVEALAALLSEVHPRRRDDPGSDVSLGIARALSRFDAASGGEIMVLSDGEWDGESSAVAQAASRARELGVRITGECFGGTAPERVAELASAGAAVATIAPAPDAGALAARRIRGWIATGLLVLAAAHGLSGRTS
jgi:Ca-activated chloride channel family protein